jgi:hypothetical protein
MYTTKVRMAAKVRTALCPLLVCKKIHPEHTEALQEQANIALRLLGTPRIREHLSSEGSEHCKAWNSFRRGIGGWEVACYFMEAALSEFHIPLGTAKGPPGSPLITCE